MGRHHGHLGRYSRFPPILPPDLYDSPPATRGQSQYTDDVHPDTWKLRVGGESCSQVWNGRLEHVGIIHRDSAAAGLVAVHGNVL